MGALRPRAPLLATALALAAAGAAVTAARAQPSPDPAPPLARAMRQEIDAMADAGVPPGDPKVEMLEDAVEDLEAGAAADPPPDPGAAGVAERIARADAARAAEARGGPAPPPPGEGTARPAWDAGPVQCEVVPGQLGPDEIAGAACASVPQRDGTARYVAVGRDGTVRTVVFGTGGAVRRAADAATGSTVPPGSVVAATPDGHLVVTPAGRRPVTVDLP